MLSRFSSLTAKGNVIWYVTRNWARPNDGRGEITRLGLVSAWITSLVRSSPLVQAALHSSLFFIILLNKNSIVLYKQVQTQESNEEEEDEEEEANR